MVEWTPALTVCLVHIRAVLEKELTSQKGILHGEGKEVTSLEVDFKMF